MGPRTRVVALVAAVLVVAAPAVPAARGRRPVPRAHLACAQAPGVICKESGNDNLPPHGYGSSNTDTVPADAGEVDTFLEPFKGLSAADLDSLWETVADGAAGLSNIKNKVVKRLITCVVVAQASASIFRHFQYEKYGEKVDTTNVFQGALGVCLAAVVSAQAMGPARDAGAASKHCSETVVSIPVQVARSGSRYVITGTNGRISKASGKGPLTVSCRVTGKGIAIKVTARRRRAKLAPILGPNFRIGFANPTNRSLPFKATFAFK
jgi:hypothetical protein